MEIHEYVEKLLLIGLVIISVSMFAINTGSNYGRTPAEMTSPSIDTSAIETQINSTTATTSVWLSELKEDNPIIYFAIVTIKSIWGMAKTMLFIIPTLFGIYVDTISNILGVPPIVTGVVTSILTISIIIGFVRWIRQ